MKKCKDDTKPNVQHRCQTGLIFSGIGTLLGVVLPTGSCFFLRDAQIDFSIAVAILGVFALFLGLCIKARSWWKLKEVPPMEGR